MMVIMESDDNIEMIILKASRVSITMPFAYDFSDDASLMFDVN